MGDDMTGSTDDRAESPLWREEFPFTSAGEEVIARRDFTRYLLAASGVFAVGTAGAAAWAGLQSANTGSPRPIVELSEVAEGTEYLFRYPTEDDPAILVHLAGGELRAFSQKCTHLGCVVFWQSDEDRLFCPCHEGVFDPLSGDPTAGPPDRPLSRIDTEVRDGVVWALGVAVGDESPGGSEEKPA
ncbi:MAG: Rieske (2Fe-2S) protein [Microthrixaceae bacterium]|nr:Rieske (2Fe-2S) protein [Microthrixaceae bacterium]